MRWLCALALFAACMAPPALAQTGDYLPRSAWADERDWEFKEKWVGGQLQAMHEPSLLHMASASPSTRSFRMLVAPTFTPAYAIRVTEREDGTGDAVYVRLDGQGGYEPGRIQNRITRRVSRADMARLRDAFQGVDFSTLPAELRNPPSCDGDIVVDGTLVVYEAIIDGRYNVVIPDPSNIPQGNCYNIVAILNPVWDALRQAAGLPTR